ncbi:MAG TPA: hypothetical protein VFE78_39415 [Gemmataceae bacterium]|nr:hypothetical protein [Gemmataceae bacterium]
MSDPPTDKGPAPRPGTEKPLTGLQVAGVLAALALLPLLCVLVAALLHAGPLLAALGAPGWTRIVAVAAAVALAVLTLLALRALRKSLRRKREALGSPDTAEQPDDHGRGP